MNLILENSKYVEYYSYLDSLFYKIPKLQEYHWVLSNQEISYSKVKKIHTSPAVFSGYELAEIVSTEKIQFVWGIFSAFLNKPKVDASNLPYADGNSSFWEGIPEPQAKDAEFEIVCWDSTCTLFIGVSEQLAESLKHLYPDIKDLNKENNKIL